MLARTLTGRVLHGIGWQVSSVLSVTVIQVLVLAVLARHLSPAAFGLVAICNIFTGFALLFGDIGLGPALVQRKELSSTQIQGAFYLTLVLGCALSGLTAALAPLIERFFDAEGLTRILRWLSLSYVIAAFGTVSKALLERQMAFKQLMRFEIGRALVAATVAIPLAIAGQGVWAIVASALVGHAFVSAGMLIYCRHPAIPRFSWAEISPMMGYGSGLTLARFFNHVALIGDYLVIGKLMGPVNLGFYERAYRIMQTPASLLGTVLDRVLFPAMSQIQDDNARLWRGFARALSLGYLLQVPVCIAIALTAPEVVALLLGEGWDESITPLRILVLSIPFRILVRLSDSLVRAKGAVYPSAVVKAIYAVLVVVGSWTAYRWGIRGVASAVLTAVVVNFLLMSQLTNRLLGITWTAHLPLIRPGIVMGLATLVIAIPLRQLARGLTSQPALVIAIFVTGLTVGLGALIARTPALFGPETDDLIDTVKAKLQKPKTTA